MLLKTAAFAAFFALGCGTCGGREAVGGDTPFTRCSQVDPTAPPATIGRLALTAKGRVIEISGTRTPLKLAVAQGPGVATQHDVSPMLAALRASDADAFVLLGGIGVESEPPMWLAQLLTVGVPVLFVPGGRDAPQQTQKAFDALPAASRTGLLDLTGWGGVKLSGYVFGIVPGSQDGRASLGTEACGFTPDDVSDALDVWGDTDTAHRVLVSWEIPSASPVGMVRTLDVGSAAWADVWRKEPWALGLYAWPDVDLMRPRRRTGEQVPWGAIGTSLELVVPRIVGLPHERADGTRQRPGFVVLRLEPTGIVAETPH